MNDECPARSDEPNLDVTDPGRHYFLPVSIAGVIFCFSLFLWFAAAFGNPEAPINRLMNRYGTGIILIETGIVGFLCILAMTLDRRATLRMIARQKREREQVLREQAAERESP